MLSAYLDFVAVLAERHRADMEHYQSGLGTVGSPLPHHLPAQRVFEVTRLDDKRIAAVLPDIVRLFVKRAAVG
jgi:hypothetical protein